MFDFAGIVGLGALIFTAGFAAVLAYRHFFGSTPLSSVHKDYKHDHCKFDADEVRRTAGQKQPRVDTSDLPPADPKVAAILAAVQSSNIEKVLRDLSGEQNITVGGQEHKIGTRNSYTSDLELSMAYLEEFYAGLKLKSERHNYQVRGRKLANLIVEFKGSVHPEKVLIVGAHLDSTAGDPWDSEDRAPGADDDLSGTAALMELAKALLHAVPGCTVRICHFTGEEQGLYGSKVYSDKVADEKIEVIAMIEMDMIGYCKLPGNRVDVHDNADQNGSHSLVEVMIRNVARYGLSLNVFDTHNHAVEGRSDHAGFLDHGFKAVLVSEEFTDEGFNPNYHSTGDRVSECNLPFATDVTRMVLAAVIELAECK